MDDLISRQAAIDAKQEFRNPNVVRDTEARTAYDRTYANGWNDCNSAWINAIKALPFAQPERTCVNCGRTANNGGWYADGGTRCPIEEHYALPKDGYCHLWEKRSVTDDDYPERREG